MSLGEIQDPAPDIELTAKEAAAYLTGPVGFTISTKVMYNLKALSKGPVVEKRGRNLVYRRSALDAFLVENGTNPHVWIAEAYRAVADQLRDISDSRPNMDFEGMIDVLENRDKEDWDPDELSE